MIALDSSAIVAIALDEPESFEFVLLITRRSSLIGRPTVLETHMVLRDRSGEDGIAILDRLLTYPKIRVIDFEEHHLVVARRAFGLYGKGRGHPAQLNFGDCMAYAIAKRENVPLLYKGEDFARTDIQAAL